MSTACLKTHRREWPAIPGHGRWLCAPPAQQQPTTRGRREHDRVVTFGRNPARGWGTRRAGRCHVTGG